MSCIVHKLMPQVLVTRTMSTTIWLLHLWEAPNCFQVSMVCILLGEEKLARTETGHSPCPVHCALTWTVVMFSCHTPHWSPLTPSSKHDWSSLSQVQYSIVSSSVYHGKRDENSCKHQIMSMHFNSDIFFRSN